MKGFHEPDRTFVQKQITMKATVLKYGLRALIIMFAFFLFAMLVAQSLPYSTQEVLGYAAMLSALSVIYFAIKHHRDEVMGGRITLGKGLTIGLIISAFAGVGSAIADLVYTTVIAPDFVETFKEAELERLRSSLPPAEYEQAAATLLEQIEWMGSPAVLALLMFVTVLILGFIISLISAFILRSK